MLPFSRSLSLAIAAAIVGLSLPARALPNHCGTRYTYAGTAYCVRTLTASSEGAVIEVAFDGTDDLGEVSTTIRQYRIPTSCRNANAASRYGFLGEHIVDNFGVVAFNNPQPPGTTIAANSDIGRAVGQAFRVSCGQG